MRHPGWVAEFCGTSCNSATYTVQTVAVEGTTLKIDLKGNANEIFTSDGFFLYQNVFNTFAMVKGKIFELFATLFYYSFDKKLTLHGIQIIFMPSLLMNSIKNFYLIARGENKLGSTDTENVLVSRFGKTANFFRAYSWDVK